MPTKTSSLLVGLLFVTGCASKAQPSASPPPAPSSAPVAATVVAPPPPPVATATPSVKVAAAPTPHARKLSIKRITLARGVDHREPLDPSTSFESKNDKVYAFVEVENPERLPGAIHVAFEPPSKKYEGEVTLAVGDSPRWRTWAFTRQAHDTGEWTAVVRDDRGHELARQTFEVL